MTHRLLAVIAVACLLGACSGGDTAADGGSSGAAPANGPGETPALEEGTVPASTTDASDSSSPAAFSDAGPPASIEEPQESSPDSEASPDGEAAPEVEATSPETLAASGGLRVLRAYVCKGIEQNEPTEAGKSFVPQDGVLRLCCFSEIAVATGSDTIYHVWRWGEREMARVPLQVKNPSWRTWSTKRILDEWRGEWHVDVTDREGRILTRLDFSVE